MNLILSDVEETILIVDQAEGAGEGQHTVNVSVIGPITELVADGEVRWQSVRWTCFSYEGMV